MFDSLLPYADVFIAASLSNSPALSNRNAGIADGFFITGTDTEIGKSYITCRIAEYLLQKRLGLAISPRKPIASGCLPQPDGHLLSEDADLVHRASQTPDDLETVCPYRFEPPISPARAISQAGAPIGLNELEMACQAPKGRFRLVEGAGGLYSPLTPDGHNLDLIQRLGLPVVLVVGNKLGCLNHALLTIRALEAAQQPIALIVLNDLSDNADPENFTDLQSLVAYPSVHTPYHVYPGLL